MAWALTRNQISVDAISLWCGENFNQDAAETFGHRPVLNSGLTLNRVSMIWPTRKL